MGTSRFSKAEAVSCAIVGHANLRRLASHDRELILRQRGQRDQERRVIVR